MSSFIKSKEIPKHKIVKFLFSENNSVIGDAIAIMDDEVSIKVSSTYGDLSPYGGNNLMTLLSNSSNGKFSSGQFALQSAQIWQKTEPLDLSFSVKFYMNTDAYVDVVTPINELMQLCLPQKDNRKIGGKNISINAGFLIPPGPNIQTILNQTISGEWVSELTESWNERGIVTIEIGKFTFHNMVIKNVTPTFSTVVDENGYPVSATVSIESCCFEVCTTGYISNVFTPKSTT